MTAIVVAQAMVFAAAMANAIAHVTILEIFVNSMMKNVLKHITVITGVVVQEQTTVTAQATIFLEKPVIHFLIIVLKLYVATEEDA